MSGDDAEDFRRTPENEMIPDLGCDECTELFALQLVIFDVLRACLLERHSMAATHKETCFIAEHPNWRDLSSAKLTGND